MRVRLAQVGVDTLRRWMLPEYLRHPEIPRGSIGWRMGYGEAYAFELAEWLERIGEAEKRRFRATYGYWPDE